MRVLRVATFLCLAVQTAWAAPSDSDDALELKLRWGDLAVLAELPAEAPPGDADLTPAGEAPRSTDVRQVLFFQPRIIEKPPYEPGTRIPDNVANAIIITGGAALLTSVIVEWLR
jgi:hypothetical protein